MPDRCRSIPLRPVRPSLTAPECVPSARVHQDVAAEIVPQIREIALAPPAPAQAGKTIRVLTPQVAASKLLRRLILGARAICGPYAQCPASHCLLWQRPWQRVVLLALSAARVAVTVSASLLVTDADAPFCLRRKQGQVLSGG